MRILTAGLLGGVVVFLWGAVSHMLLPIGSMGIHGGTPHEAVLQALHDNTPHGEGIYMLPSLSEEQFGDQAAMQAMQSVWRSNPYAFIVYQPQGDAHSDMGDELGREFATNLVSAWLAAWLLASAPFSFRRRLAMATALGVFGWLIVSVPYWNWYRFPLDFTVGALLQHGIGWLLAGAVMAWWLGRKPA